MPPPGDLADPGIEPLSPALQEDFLPSEPSRKPKTVNIYIHKISGVQEAFGKWEVSSLYTGIASNLNTFVLRVHL